MSGKKTNPGSEPEKTATEPTPENAPETTPAPADRVIVIDDQALAAENRDLHAQIVDLEDRLQRAIAAATQGQDQLQAVETRRAELESENATLKGHFEAARQELQEFLEADAEEEGSTPVERLLLALHTVLGGILGESHTPEDTERVLIRLGEDAQYNVHYPEQLTRGLMGIAAEVRALQAERAA